MDYVYIVKGCSGEYDSIYDWDVCAYLDEDLAMTHASLARIRAEEIEKIVRERRTRGNDYTGWNAVARGEIKNEYDVNMPANSDVYYSVEEVDLKI